MKNRQLWLELIQQAWEKRPILWLSGVRRVGKTCLCKSIDNIEYYDCELPRIRHQLEDPELFFKNKQNKNLIFDEIHRLSNPAETLKIAADHFPTTRIIATGSSTLEASSKFGDTLTGRKQNFQLTPLLLTECELFGNDNINHRFVRGGLPPFFMSKELPENEFTEWLDSYWAKDIQELFHLEKRYSFLKFAELLFAQSGGIFDATKFTSPCEVSRTTIANYLSVLEATFVINLVRPFSTNSATEIISAPKVFAFDTGFICYAKGWQQLRQEDKGLLWEHCILNEIYGRLQNRKIYYWRDKQQHEIDFIYLQQRNQNAPIAIECKWQARTFDPKNLQIFRRRYPQGLNFVVSYDVDESFDKKYDNIQVTFVNSSELVKKLITTQPLDKGA